MDKSIQDKINQIKSLANKPKSFKNFENEISNDDSLSKSIRNTKEANTFLNELKFAIDLASRKEG